LDFGFWWLMMNRDIHEIVEPMTNVKKHVNFFAKLVTTLHEEQFQKWGLDFIGLVKPTSRMLSN
jgi:hypothetical protein